MSTLDLITAARPSLVRPAWCAKEQLGEKVIGTLYEPARGELTLRAVAANLDQHAALRGWTVGEVARVRKGEFEAVYARPAQEEEKADAQEQATDSPGPADGAADTSHTEMG